MILEKYSMGIGDRFGQQGSAQLQSIIKANEDVVSRHVCENLFERHIKRLFMI